MREREWREGGKKGKRERERDGGAGREGERNEIKVVPQTYYHVLQWK